MATYGNFFKAARKAKAEDTPRARAPKKRSPAQRSRGAGNSWWVIGVSSIGLVCAAWALFNVEEVETFVARVDVGVFGSAKAESKPAKSSQDSKSSEAKASSEESPAASKSSAGSKTWTPEQLSVFNKLEEKRVSLEAKEQSLQKLEEELQRQRVELEERVKELERLRTKIAERLAEKVAVDQDRVAKLVDIYSNMKPQNAAKVFEEIDEDLAVEVLGKMKKKNMADILNLLKSDKAQRLSEKFAGYQGK